MRSYVKCKKTVLVFFSINQIVIFNMAVIADVTAKSTKAKSMCVDSYSKMSGTSTSLVCGRNRSGRWMTEFYVKFRFKCVNSSIVPHFSGDCGAG